MRSNCREQGMPLRRVCAMQCTEGTALAGHAAQSSAPDLENHRYGLLRCALWRWWAPAPQVSMRAAMQCHCCFGRACCTAKLHSQAAPDLDKHRGPAPQHCATH